MEAFLFNISKFSSDCGKQIALLMIPNEGKERCHYLAVKNKILYIIYADLEYLTEKSRWICKQPGKIFSNKSRKTYSLRIFYVNYLCF